MNVAQNVSAIFNSPQIAEMALQAVQAGELAELQGLAKLRHDAKRRENQVRDPEEASRPSGVDPRTQDHSEPARHARHLRNSNLSGASEQSRSDAPGAGDGRHIDLVA